MKWFQDRKTVLLCSIILVLAMTNLYTVWNPRSTKDASASVSPSVNFIPLQVTCQPIADAANAQTLTLHCSLSNPTQTDMKQTSLTLKDVTNASLVDANFAPRVNSDGSFEWELGVLPAMQQFDVFVTLQRAGSQPVSAWLSGKSDGSPIVMTPLVENAKLNRCVASMHKTSDAQFPPNLVIVNVLHS